LFKVLPIIAPGGQTVSAFSHQGDNDLRIRFSSPRTEVTATERTQEDMDAMRELINMTNSVVVGDESV
jgi:hypothetical protein